MLPMAMPAAIASWAPGDEGRAVDRLEDDPVVLAGRDRVLELLASGSPGRGCRRRRSAWRCRRPRRPGRRRASARRSCWRRRTRCRRARGSSGPAPARWRPCAGAGASRRGRCGGVGGGDAAPPQAATRSGIAATIASKPSDATTRDLTSAHVSSSTRRCRHDPSECAKAMNACQVTLQTCCEALIGRRRRAVARRLSAGRRPPIRRPRTNQTARAGTSPALNSRCGVRRVEADRVARLEHELVEADPDGQGAAQDVAPLLAGVALEGIGRARLAADLVGHVEEVDVPDRLGREPLPDDARTRAGCFDREAARCTGSCGRTVSIGSISAPASPSRPAAACP